MVNWFVLAALVVGAGIATVTDLRSRRIPNALTGPLFVVLLLLRFWQVHGIPWDSLLATAVIVVLFGALAAFGMMGWGDVKLAGALAAAGGLQFGLSMILIGSVAAGIVALVFMVGGALVDVLASGIRGAAAISVALIPAVRARGRRTIPYGPTLAFGALAAAFLVPGLPM